MQENYVQGQIWDENYLDSFNIGRLKKDLAWRVFLSKSDERQRNPIDFNLMVNLVENKYSSIKTPKALLNSIAEYQDKRVEDVDMVDLAQMYSSIRGIFGNELNNKDLLKWKRANKLSFFGFEQFVLMEKYLQSKFF